MPVLIALTMYTIQEACQKLAEIKRRPTYSRQRLTKLVSEQLQSAEKIDNRYYLTDTQIKWLAERIAEKPGPRPQKPGQ